MFYRLAESSWDNREKEVMHDVIETGMHSMGEQVKEFEEEFSKWLGCKYCVMVNSGSTANLLGVFSLLYHSKHSKNINNKKKIIVPAVSWSTTYFPLHQAGFELVFVDVDKETLNIDVRKVKEALETNSDVYGICAVNLLGNPADLIELKLLSEEYDVVLFEDNCESLGADINGKKTGTFGEFGSFSFFFSHHLCTMEGGMIATDDEELYHIILSLRAHGWVREVPNEKFLKIDCDEFEKRFRFILPGFNVRPTEMQGALGLCQLSKVDDFMKFRRSNAEIFRKYFSTHPEIILQKESGFHTYFGFSILLPKSIDRNDLASYLHNEGIETRPVLAGNFLKNPVLKHLNYSISGSFDNSDYIDEHGLFFGSHNRDLSETFQKTFEKFENYLSKNGY